MENSNKIQRTSSNHLLFHVEDVLGIAQIRAHKFSKQLKKFNLKKAIEEVIQIQKDKADMGDIRVTSQIKVNEAPIDQEL